MQLQGTELTNFYNKHTLHFGTELGASCNVFLSLFCYSAVVKDMCPNCKSRKGYKIAGKQDVPKSQQKELGKTITLVTCKACNSTTNKTNW